MKLMPRIIRLNKNTEMVFVSRDFMATAIPTLGSQPSNENCIGFSQP